MVIIPKKGAEKKESKYNDVSSDMLELFIDHLKREHKLSRKKISEIIKKKHKLPEDKKFELPVYIFTSKRLSALESIAKYLKEDVKLKYHEIAELLNRNDRTIWTTYQNARKKSPGKLIKKYSAITIPVFILKDRRFGVLELISEYLKDVAGLSYHEISKLLMRNDRTIWTTYQRVKKKRDNVKE